MRYEGVIFDFDGVLLKSGNDGFQWAAETRRKKARELGKEYDFDAEGFLFSASSFEEMDEMVKSSPFTWEEYEKIERAVAERKVEMVRKGEMQLFPDTRKVLESLDVPASVVSNAFGDAVDRIVTETGIDSELEFWTAPRMSEVERYHSIWKPEAHMLEKAMEVMSVENAVMVGDQPFDVKAAENAGIESIYIERNDKDVEPTHRAENLKQVLEIVSGS